MSEQERMERRAKNLQWQVDYMCSDIAKVLDVPVDSPSEAVDMVRWLKMYADGRDEKIARVRALATGARGFTAQDVLRALDGEADA